MIFYFTGTGNSLYIARELDVDIRSIPQVINWTPMDFTADRIGIVCPIYGHEMPTMVKDFLAKVAFHTDYLFLILTYGEMHGGAAEIADRYLCSVGKRADYINSIQMVDNFLPSFDMDEQRAKDKKIPEQLSVIKQDLAEKKKAIQKANLRDKAVHRMYIGFTKNQPETMWASYRVTDDCIGCGLCTKVCPAGCIKLVDQRAVHSLEGCQACMACVHVCPRKAIKMTMKEPNPNARYRNEHIALRDLVAANNQTDY